MRTTRPAFRRALLVPTVAPPLALAAAPQATVVAHRHGHANGPAGSQSVTPAL